MRLLRRIGAMILVTGLCLLASEGLLWLLLPLPPDQGMVVEFTQEIPGVASRVRYERNREGLRSRSMTSGPKGERTVRVVGLGASTTNQRMQNIEDTWSGILDRKLQEAFEGHGIRIEVAVWGRGGNRVWDGVEFCRSRLPALEPDIVLNLWGINSLSWNGGPGYRYPGAQVRSEEIERRRRERLLREAEWGPRLADACGRVSQVCRRLRRLRIEQEARRAVEDGGAIVWKGTEGRAERARMPYREALVRDPDPIDEFRDGLEALLACEERLGARPVVLAQPALWKAEMSEAEVASLWFPLMSREGPLRMAGGWLQEEMARYNRVQERVALDRGAAWIPLEAGIPKDLDHFFDDCHFTDRGSRLAAEILVPHLLRHVEEIARRRGLLPRPSAGGPAKDRGRRSPPTLQPARARRGGA